MNFYQNETALEGCPFCGRRDTVGFLTTNYPGERRVVCNAQEGGCGGSVGAGDSDDEAARKWNRRNNQGHNVEVQGIAEAGEARCSESHGT